MSKLSTIQKNGKLNEIYQVGDTGPGDVYHMYGVTYKSHDIAGDTLGSHMIVFQKGPRNEMKSTHGLLDQDLLEIVRDRLTCFQKGDFATRENACALTHIEEALLWLNKRVEDRIERQVLGTYKK